MNKNSDISTLILPSDLSVGDRCSVGPISPAKSVRQARYKKLVVGGIATMLLVGMLCTLYFYLGSQESLEKEREVGQAVDFKGSHRLIIDSDQMDFSKGVEFFNVREVILRNFNLRVFDTTPFPSLESLIIEPHVRLDDLVVNNTQLKEFSYNSSDLKTLKLINNKKLVRFLNSNIPSLTHIYVTMTPITSFTNNKLGSLTYLQFTDSQIQKLHLTDTNVKTLILTNCGNISTYPDSFSKYESLQSLKIDRCNFSHTSQFQNMGKLTSIVISASNFQEGIHITNCRPLDTLNIQSEYIKQIILNDNSNLLSFFPKVTKIQKISLIEASISEFTIDTNQLIRLQIIGGQEKIQKIPNNIPGLKQLLIAYTAIGNDQFANLEFPNLDSLSIEGCPLISIIKNSFPKLLKLEITKLREFDLTPFNAPMLQVVKIKQGETWNIDLEPFTHLREVTIDSVNVHYLTVSPSVTHLYLKTLQTVVGLSFKTTFLQHLDIEDLNNLFIKNQDFSNLELLKITDCYNILVTNNKFTKKLTSFLIDKNLEDFNFTGNTFDFDPLIQNVTVAIQHNQFRELQQRMAGFKSISIRGNQLQKLSTTLDMLPDVEQMFASSNKFNNISAVNNPVLTVLMLGRSNQLRTFESNRFQSLTELDLSQSSMLTKFSNNTVPKLESLNIAYNQGLKDSQILQEFGVWASKETNLLSLVIEDRGDEFDAKVKEIFPHINILKS